MKISTNTFVVRTGAFVAGILVVFALSQLVQWSTAEAQLAEPTMEYNLMKKFSGPYPDGYSADQFTFDIVGISASGTPISLLGIELEPNGVGVTDTAVTVVDLPMGEYTITENGPDDFVPEDWVIQWSDPKGCDQQTADSTQITIDDDNFGLGNVGCRADNQWKPVNPDPEDPEPTTGVLVVQKIVINDDGGTAATSSFSFSVNGGSSVSFETSGLNTLTLATGTYSIVESPLPSGYNVSYDSCANVVVTAGATTTCTIVNDDQGGGNGGQCVDETQGSWADDVISSDQGLRLNNSSVLAERSNTNNVLGNAGGGFFSLGFGGEIVVEFDSYVPNVAGNDFTVYEITNGDDYPEESAEVYVSQNGAVWHLVGEANNLSGDNTTSFDFDSTGLDWINQIRLVDTTDSADFEAAGSYNDASMPDGFDLDAIEATQQVCDEPGDGGNGGDEDVYLVYGYVWHDENENDDWEQEQPNPEDNETDLSGWTVNITNGSTTHSTTTDADGYYYFYVPAGTWTINQVVMTNWEQTFPNVNGHVVEVGIDEDQAQTESNNFFAQLLSFVIPTALAAQIDNNNACNPFCGPHDFGNVFRGDSGGGYSQGSYGGGGGNGKKVELSSSGGNGDDDDDDGPTPQVLGEATSVIPQGAPYTGSGGAAPLSVNLPTLLAVLTTSQRSVRASHAK